MNNIQIENDTIENPFQPSWITILVAPIAAVLPVLATFIWIFVYLPPEFRGLRTGTVNWSNAGQTWQSFNWHPILMILFMMFGALAIFCFKMLPGGHFFKKVMHGIFHLFAVAASIAGFIFMVWWKEKTGNLHIWTLHSWIGIAVLGLYWLQFLLGFIAFLLPGPMLISKHIRAAFVIVHRHAGLHIWIALAVVVVTGFAQREWLMLLSQSSISPAFGQQRSSSYWGANAISLLIGLIGAVVLIVFRHIKPAQDEHHYSPIQAISYH